MTKKADGNEIKTMIWRVSHQADECALLSSVPAEDIIHATAFSNSGRLLAVGGEDRTIRTLQVDSDFQVVSELCCVAVVRCLAWSPDSRFLASGGEDMQVSVWDLIAEMVVLQLPKSTDWILGVSFSSDGLWLGYCGNSCSEVCLEPLEIEFGADANGQENDEEGVDE